MGSVSWILTVGPIVAALVSPVATAFLFVRALVFEQSTAVTFRPELVERSLERALAAFATGHGASMMTITETYENAKRHPEKYDLPRTRVGAGPVSS
jgi:hypothetical protein